MARATWFGCAAVVVLACGGAGAANLVFNYSGAEYTLREDGTWSCTGGWCPAADAEDFPVTLSDNREVVLGARNQWRFKEAGEIVGTSDIKVNDVSAKTSGKSGSIDRAEQQATTAALKKASDRIVAGAPKRGITAAKVTYCIKYLRIYPEVKTTKDPSGAWNATASLVLNRRQIVDIVECAQQVEDSRVTAADSGAAKKK